MASRPLKWRILAVFGGLDLDAVEDNTEPTCGAMQEMTDLAGSSAEVSGYLSPLFKLLERRHASVWCT